MDGVPVRHPRRPALLLAALAAPAFSPIQATEGKREAAEREIAETVAAIERYRRECGELPDCLHLLVLPDEQGKTFLSRKGMPVDPWGAPYEYDFSDGEGGRWMFEVRSFGSDRSPGGEGEAADIRRVSKSGPAASQPTSAEVLRAKAEILDIVEAVRFYEIRNGSLPE
ncbi:MAG TPA: type II secretion system protein GspG, partial [Planctomycetota bacterium]|nr:type II secretion system protein GspG [Planctomycetota bacterium]